MQGAAHPLYERLLEKVNARSLSDDTAEEAAFERVLAQLSRRSGDPPSINPTIPPTEDPTIPPIENPTIPPIDNLPGRFVVDDTAVEAAFERVLAQLSRRGGDLPPINPTIPPVENPTIPPIDNLPVRFVADGPERRDKGRG